VRGVALGAEAQAAAVCAAAEQAERGGGRFVHLGRVPRPHALARDGAALGAGGEVLVLDELGGRGVGARGRGEGDCEQGGERDREGQEKLSPPARAPPMPPPLLRGLLLRLLLLLMRLLLVLPPLLLHLRHPPPVAVGTGGTPPCPRGRGD